MTGWLNNCSAVWFDWMSDMMWQSAVLIAIVWAADLLLRRFAWPQLRFVLWMLVFIKLLLPPGFGMPTSITSHGIATIKTLISPDVALPAQGANIQDALELIKFTQPATAESGLKTVAPSLSWQTKLMMIWVAGMVSLISWLYLRLRQFRINRSRSFVPEWLNSVLQECATRLSLKWVPEVVVTSAVKCPAVFGFFRPTIMIPPECINVMDRQQACNVLVHELTHIKRGDPLILVLQIALQILYWPNILLWIIRRPVHDLRELCCDAAAVSALRENTASYRQTLIYMARQLIAEPSNPGLGLLGLFEQPHSIVARLKYLEKPHGRQPLCKCLSAVAAILMLVFVLPMSSVGVQIESQGRMEGAKPDTPPADQEKASFEVISIRRSIGREGTDIKFLPGGTFRASGTNLKLLIAQSYGVDYLFVDGPDLIEKEMWNIEARPKQGKYPLKSGLLDPAVGNLMIKSMLEDRCKLKAHLETRVLKGYELVVAKGGAKIKLSKDQTKSRGSSVMAGHLKVLAGSLSGNLAPVLSRILQFFEGDRDKFRVVDKTGIEGLYDMELNWTADRRSSHDETADSPEISIFEAIQEQLGLKLVPAKIPTQFVVVDEVQLPSVN